MIDVDLLMAEVACMRAEIDELRRGMLGELGQLTEVRRKLAAVADALLPRAEAMLSRVERGPVARIAHVTDEASRLDNWAIGEVANRVAERVVAEVVESKIAERVAERAADEVREQVEAILATGVADPEPRVASYVGAPPLGTPVPLTAPIERLAPPPQDDHDEVDLDEVADEVTGDDPRSVRGRKLRTIVAEAVAVLRTSPRTWPTQELREAVRCPEPRWASVARELSLQPGVRFFDLGQGRGRGYTMRPLSEIPAHAGEGGLREKARQVAALLEASAGHDLAAAELRDACGIASEGMWRRVVECLADWPQVSVMGVRGGRRYRWGPAKAQEVE